METDVTKTKNTLLHEFSGDRKRAYRYAKQLSQVPSGPLSSLYYDVSQEIMREDDEKTRLFLFDPNLNIRRA